MYDTHVHSRFSSDAVSGIEEYIRLFDEGKLERLGLAEHRDFMPECGAYGFLNPEEYISCVRSYRNKGYEVFAGAEIDYAKEVEADILNALKTEAYDFTICSVHMVNKTSVSNKSSGEYITNLKEFRSVLEDYYFELFSCLKSGAFDVIGHIGVYKRYIPTDFFIKNSYKSRIDEVENQLAKDCAKSDCIVEVNTSGLFSPYASMVPNIDFVKEYFRLGGRRISIGSDAHEARFVARGFDVVQNTLKEIGFKYVYLPWDKENPLKLD